MLELRVLKYIMREQIRNADNDPSTLSIKVGESSPLDQFFTAFVFLLFFLLDYIEHAPEVIHAPWGVIFHAACEGFIAVLVGNCATVCMPCIFKVLVPIFLLPFAMSRVAMNAASINTLVELQRNATLLLGKLRESESA